MNESAATITAHAIAEPLDLWLKKDWMEFWQAVTNVPYDEIGECWWRELVTLWSDSRTRRYHDLSHFAHGNGLLGWASEKLNLNTRQRLFIFAFLAFHDAIQAAGCSVNEMLSATYMTWAIGEFSGVGVFSIADVHALSAAITASKTHEMPEEYRGTVYEFLIALCLDIDLAIFGESEKIFDEYDRVGIPFEYSSVPRPIFCAKRAEVLEGYLNRNPIYQTELFRERLETQARANLARAIAHWHAEATKGNER